MKDKVSNKPSNPLTIGLRLRDYFAARAMQAMLTNAGGVSLTVDGELKLFKSCDEKYSIAVCAASYLVADTMLVQREKEVPGA